MTTTNVAGGGVVVWRGLLETGRRLYGEVEMKTTRFTEK